MKRIFAATASALLLTALAAGPAAAGSCPKEHVLSKPRPIESIPLEKLTREILTNVRLEGWQEMGAFLLRMRRLELQPGGFVPTHDHDDRPSIVYVIKGTVVEHNSLCAVPIEHHAGDVTPEFGAGHSHWWENKGLEVVTFISADVIPHSGPEEPRLGFE